MHMLMLFSAWGVEAGPEERRVDLGVCVVGKKRVCVTWLNADGVTGLPPAPAARVSMLCLVGAITLLLLPPRCQPACPCSLLLQPSVLTDTSSRRRRLAVLRIPFFHRMNRIGCRKVAGELSVLGSLRRKNRSCNFIRRIRLWIGLD